MFSRRTMMSAVTCLLVLICAPAASADDTPWLQTAEDLQSRLTECTSGFQRIIQEAYKLIDTDRPDPQSLNVLQESAWKHMAEVQNIGREIHDQLDTEDIIAQRILLYANTWTMSLNSGLETLNRSVAYVLEVANRSNSNGSLNADHAHIALLGLDIAKASLDTAFVCCTTFTDTMITSALLAKAIGLSDEPPTTPSETPTWQPIATWSGNGMKTTEPFQVLGTPWRASWKAEMDDFGFFQVYAYPVGGSILEASVIATTMSLGEDTSYIYSGPGDYYLVISAAGCRWTITIEDKP